MLRVFLFSIEEDAIHFYQHTSSLSFYIYIIETLENSTHFFFLSSNATIFIDDFAIVELLHFFFLNSDFYFVSSKKKMSMFFCPPPQMFLVIFSLHHDGRISSCFPQLYIIGSEKCGPMCGSTTATSCILSSFTYLCRFIPQF